MGRATGFSVNGAVTEWCYETDVPGHLKDAPLVKLMPFEAAV
jgi:hypothetical protein